jgi:hypothetical protein
MDRFLKNPFTLIGIALLTAALSFPVIYYGMMKYQPEMYRTISSAKLVEETHTLSGTNACALASNL